MCDYVIVILASGAADPMLTQNVNLKVNVTTVMTHMRAKKKPSQIRMLSYNIILCIMNVATI